LGTIEKTIAGFIRVHNAVDPSLPSPDGPRALLKAQMAALADTGNRSAGWSPRLPWIAGTAAAVLCLSVTLIALTGRVTVLTPAAARFAPRRMAVVTIPRSNLTPGSVLLVSREEVCRPQSYAATAWNAYVKDAIEERLRNLVCEGDLDLQTAQRELSQDWIAAYKKYFRTDRPLETNQ
jgi:hypothetical protein